ncbi:MAG: hypothetical protein H7X91_02835 [Burkholderiales bacterium]|nr:hypothetical protein [Burkholderiales bacterium]
MIRIGTCLVAALLVAATAFAAQDDIIGTFKGSEKLTLTACSNSTYDGISKSTWEATIQDLNGNSYKGKASNANGNFEIDGQITGSETSGTLKGVNKWGQAWTGEFKGTLEDNRYKSKATGSVPASGCQFVSEVEASKI